MPQVVELEIDNAGVDAAFEWLHGLGFDGQDLAGQWSQWFGMHGG